MYNRYFADFGSMHGLSGQRAKRGDMGPIILRQLLLNPMHGYEIIGSLEERSHGMWRPSAGAVYPNLQMLEEQELVVSHEESGKRIYALTDKGKDAAKQADEHFKSRFEGREDFFKNMKELKLAFMDTMGYMKQIAMSDSPEKIDRAKQILEETQKKLGELLEEDTDKS